MSDAVNKAPSLDEQISQFKSFTTVDGEVRPDPIATTVPEGEGDEGDAAPAKPQTAAERLAALDGKPAKPKAAKAGEDGEPLPEDDDDAGTAEEDEEDARKPTKAETRDRPKPSADKRIAQAVGRQRAAERERDAAQAGYRTLEARLARLESGGLTPQAPHVTNQGVADQDTPPDPNEYQYGELDSKYISDLARHETLKTIRDEQNRQTSARKAQSDQLSAAQAREKFQTFEAEGLARYDDFDEVVTESAKRGEWALSPLLASLVIESEHGTDIAYHLASNRAEAKKVYGMTPAQQAAWFGRREAVLSSEAPGAGSSAAKMVSRAPEAPRHVARGSGSRGQASPDTTDFASFERMATRKQ